MQKAENKTNNSVKSKLVAAIAMLLVATIMVVSSTYAWFTLSTKPEVTGISTAVGANGALEMLLATKGEGNAWFYGTGTVSSEEAYVRNTYWGNLVDLSDPRYGSGGITLYPSLLNVSDGKITLDAPIQTPVYGADGRVSGTGAGGMFALYDGTKSFLETDNYGFRAVGIASGLTARQQAFRVSLANILVNQATAQSKARTSLSANGSTLAGIAIKKAMTTDPFNKTEIDAVGDMIEGLEESLAAIEAAYIEFIYATINGKSSGLEDVAADAAVSRVKDAVAGAGTALGAKLTAALGAAGKTTADLGENYNIFKTAIGNLATAKSAYNDISDSQECAWSDLRPALIPLVDVETIEINGIPAKDVNNRKSELASQIIAGKGIVVSIPSGGGIYADVADYTGNYTVGITIKGGTLDVGGVSLEEDVDATMKTDSSYNKAILTTAKETVGTPDNQPIGNSSTNPITEFYGYAVDLAFKTNAATSNLLLQTEAADRIYDGNQNEETMGKGSSMTFATADATFTTAKMRGLMSRLRVVFYDTADGTIFAKAKLDTDENDVEETADGLKANLYIVDENDAFVDDQKIVELDANLPKHVSMLVYLDGTGIQNSDVAATAFQSMTGSFNIQFASSAELQPMEYGDLHQMAATDNNP